jgi:surface antigen/LysM repeat protein
MGLQVVYSREDTLQTQQRNWIRFQQYTVVNVVVSTCLIVVFGLGVVGLTSRVKVDGAQAQAIVNCSIVDRTYVAIGGEQLASVAAYYGLRAGEIAAYNHLADPYKIYTNQRICIPSNVPVKRNTKSSVPIYRLPVRLAAPVALINSAAYTDVEKRDQPDAPAFQPVPTRDMSVSQAWRRVPAGFMARAARVSANTFPYGQCTWWAAQRYYQLHNVFVPWMNDGNAGQWVDRAIAFGWHVSSVPVVGSVIVLQGGVQGASSVGHVGIVEQITGKSAVIASSMNWGDHPGAVSKSMFSEGPGVAFLSQ